MKVWLSTDEVNKLLDATDDSEEYIGIGLAVRCGLRSHEVLQVAPEHIHNTDMGHILRVWHGKGDKYRETPIPPDLAGRIETVADIRNDTDSPVLSITTTRSFRNMINRVVERINNDDQGWKHLTPHDLRRTWATQLHDAEADPLVIMSWGGWNDLETFLDHYKGTNSPESQRRERQKVPWL